MYVLAHPHVLTQTQCSTEMHCVHNTSFSAFQYTHPCNLVVGYVGMGCGVWLSALHPNLAASPYFIMHGGEIKVESDLRQQLSHWSAQGVELTHSARPYFFRPCAR